MITLSSDFGWPYPAAIRGVLASRSSARLIDITHAFPRGDVRTAAFWLREILPWFPPAVHLVVVDPGVGTDRDVLAIEADDHVLVGPDNGVLVPVASALDPEYAVFALDQVSARSHTFHGRDVFAPLAARIHEADEWSLTALSGIFPVETFETVQFPKPNINETEAVGEVLVIDQFGNAITNIPGSFLSTEWDRTISVNGAAAPVAQTYADVDPKQRLLTVGSHENVEMAVHGGRGDEAFGVTRGSPVHLQKHVD